MEVTPRFKEEPKPKRRGLAPMSAKRRGEIELRKQVRGQVMERDGFKCRGEGLLPGACSGQLEVHEIVPRSAWAAGYLVPENCLSLCSKTHHPWVTDHPAEAAAVGFHAFSWERPA